MEITQETVDGVSVLAPQGEYLIAGNVDDFRHDIGPLLEANPNVVFDMSLLAVRGQLRHRGPSCPCLRRVNAAGGDLKLFGISKQVYSVFQITRMHRIFDIFDTRDQAIEAFQPAAA